MKSIFAEIEPLDRASVIRPAILVSAASAGRRPTASIAPPPRKERKLRRFASCVNGIRPPRPRLVFYHDEPINAGLRTPHLAWPAEQLTDRCATLVARETVEGFARRIESHDGIGHEIGDPDLVVVVDIDRVTAALALRQAPDFPRLVHRIVATDFSRIPEAHPQQPLGIRPDAARPDTRLWRRHHQCITAHRIDLGYVVACKRGIPDLTARGCRYPVGSSAFRRFPGFDLATRGIDPAIHTVLPRKPQNTFAIEGRGVEIRAGKFLR